MTVIERFLKYVAFDTQSNEKSDTCPSTQGQMFLAEHLKTEAEAIGLSEISLDKNAYLMASLPSNTPAKLPVIGFIAHLDTSPDVSGKNVKPQIVKNEAGEDIIVTDGTTLLGADDKAGIAEIMTAMEYLINHPEIPHGKIRIAFTPDEEIGRGPHLFDVEKFGCEWAYTVDGGEIGELEYETFNAAAVKVKIKGMNVHPGYAKNLMLNALLVGNEFISALPANERPATTCGYEGFYHLTDISGCVEESELNFIVRDHDAVKFDSRLKFMQEIAEQLNRKYGRNTVLLEIRHQYRNMLEIIEKRMDIVHLAERAMQKAGIAVKKRPVRGGTDGAQLSFKGLPCPNIFAGGINFHSRLEYIPVGSMEKAVETIVNIASEVYRLNL